MPIGIGIGIGVTRLGSGGGAATSGGGLYLYADPIVETAGATGVISQLYTNLTGTLVYAKVSGDARVTINAATGAISTSTPVYSDDDLDFVASVTDTVTTTFIEAVLEISGTTASGPTDGQPIGLLLALTKAV